MRFRTFFLFLLLAELTSYTANFFPILNTIGFFVIIGAALVLSMRRLEHGLYVVLVDLILGGKSGTLFSVEYAGFFLSLRMALFIVVMGVWLGKVVSAWTRNSSRFPSPGLRPPSPFGRGEGEGILKSWAVLGIAIGWGILVGLVRGNNFGDLFLDANGYLYVAMVLPFLWVTTQMDANTSAREWMRILAMVFTTATTWLAIKTLLTVYVFTHAGNNFIAANLVSFYQWVRDSGVGEITWLPGNFARVFFQSHVFNAMALFLLLMVRRLPTSAYLLIGLNAAAIIASLSRSIFVGVGVGLIAMLTLYLWSSAHQPRPTSETHGKHIAARLTVGIFFGLVLLLIAARFPFPHPAPIDLSAAAQSRLQAEEAVASRWNLLPPLWSATLRHPALGSGFGTTVSYISNDPRIRAQNKAGQYTTYAFEWGWLDLWLKMGLLGLIAYAGLLLTLLRKLYCARQFAGAGVLIALAVINVFTPYLNHPLGFGILIMLSISLCYPQKRASNI